MPYVGNVPTVLVNRIKNSLLGSEGDDDTRVLYVPYMAIIQSSGMGKSRAVDKVAEGELVIPMVLRPDNSSGTILYSRDPNLSQTVTNLFRRISPRRYKCPTLSHRP